MNFRFILLFTIIITSGCAATTQPYSGSNAQYKDEYESEKNSQFFLRTDNDEDVTAALVGFMKDNGFDVTRYSKELIVLKYDGGIFLISPKASVGGLSRLIVTKLYKIEPEYRETLEIIAYVLELNKKFNIATFSFSDDYEDIHMQSSITFVDTLAAKEIRKFMEYFNSSVLSILIVMPESIKYLK